MPITPTVTRGRGRAGLAGENAAARTMAALNAGPPVLGRPSPAAAGPAALRGGGQAPEAAYRADGGDGDWCALRAASVAGVRHRLSGEAGQDSFAWIATEDCLAVAVADGLGSVPGSAGAASRGLPPHRSAPQPALAVRHPSGWRPG